MLHFQTNIQVQNVNEDDFGSATDLTEFDKEKIRKMYNCLPPQTKPESNSTFITYELQLQMFLLRISACGKSIVPQTLTAKVATQIQELDIKTVSFFQILK